MSAPGEKPGSLGNGPVKLRVVIQIDIDAGELTQAKLKTIERLTKELSELGATVAVAGEQP